MKAKKTDKANLEKKRFLFFQIGLIVAVSMSLIAFEWTSSTSNLEELKGRVLVDEDPIEVKITVRDIPKPEKKVILPEEIEIIDNKDKEKNAQVINTGITETYKMDTIEIYNPPEPPSEEPEVVYIAQKMPEFQGEGYASFSKWIGEHINYSESMVSADIKGKVIVAFVINKEGDVEDVRLLRGVHKELDNEVIRVIKSSPKWTPGYQNLHPVNVHLTIPIVFRIER